MNYESLYEEFKKLFADDSIRIDQLETANGIDRSDGMHVAFSLVVVPLVEELINCGCEAGVGKAFRFFENMCKSENTLICEVLEFTVLEGFISLGSDCLMKKQNIRPPET